MPVTEENIWLLDMIEDLRRIKDELAPREPNSQRLRTAKYHIVIALETLFDHEQFLSGEAVMGMD